MKITIETHVNANIPATWAAWNSPEAIRQWNTASEDWHTTQSRVDLREGGTFCSRMEAKDGSMGFDFEGTYTKIVENELIEFSMGDGRSVSVRFEETGNGVKVTEIFDAESEHDAEMQRAGWQGILDNFARYVESRVQQSQTGS